MSRTNDLRLLIKNMLETVCENTFFERADEDKMYPHIVFCYDFISTGDSHRHDATVDIDLWDRGTSAVRIEDMADAVEDLFNNQNKPQDTILPTFYLAGRKTVPDEDKTIKHRLIQVMVQNYER